jgi:hypothetical protein
MFELSIFPEDTLKPSAAIYACEPWYEPYPEDCPPLEGGTLQS